MKGFATLLVLPLVWAVAAGPAFALDPPHDTTKSIECRSCHTPHHAPGGSLTTIAGNANLCQSCHLPGGSASGKALVNSDQALPGPGLPSGVSGTGTSHRWDSGPSGHVAAGAAYTSPGKVQSSGAFAGPYAKTYTITITRAGSVGAALFSWGDTLRPGTTELSTGASVFLDQGISAIFNDGPSSPSFILGDTWRIYVRTDLREPTDPALSGRLAEGKATCSTCHDQHSQAREPFDPTAPAYGGMGTGQGRHFQRIDNATEAVCQDCHGARNVPTSTQGSHPVGVLIPLTGRYQPPATLPLDPLGQVACETCHQVHYSPSTDGTLRRIAGTTALCTECHTLADTSTPASHFISSSPATLWPGGQYGSTLPAVMDATKQGSCASCHHPHGWPDSANTAQDYPLLLVDREENLCYTCHDGSPAAKNVRAEFQKTYSHPTATYTGRHSPTEGGNQTSYGAANRHAECVDCHNPHRARGDAPPPTAPDASNRIRGVGRVAVANGAAGTVPTYTYLGPFDSTAPIAEYQVCFKCHSSWTTQPAGQTNLAVAFNSNNPSYHPVEAAGKNTNINLNAFVNGWTGAKTMFCTDCHTSDGVAVRGPHGSAYRYLLKKPYSASSGQRTMSSTESCFDCHRYDTYANNNANDTVKSYSRFNPPAFSEGHTFHVGSRRYPCYACHGSHGSTTKPHLIVTGRSPGLNNYTESTTGGTCSPTCHGSETYTLNYAR
jgi:predicted CXXCH cytochrome family protein